MNSDCIFPDVIPEEKKPLEPPTELDENYEEEDRLVLVSVNFEKSLGAMI